MGFQLGRCRLIGLDSGHFSDWTNGAVSGDMIQCLYWPHPRTVPPASDIWVMYVIKASSLTTAPYRPPANTCTDVPEVCTVYVPSLSVS